MTVVRQLCNRYVSLHRINFTIHQKPAAAPHTHIRVLVPSRSHNLAGPHHNPAPHQGPSTHLPPPHRRPPDDHSLRKFTGGMDATPEREPKKPREPDSTLSLPHKKPREPDSTLSLPHKKPREPDSTLSLPHKKPREPDSTLSPPHKKVQHKSLSSVGGSCVDELMSCTVTAYAEEDHSDAPPGTDMSVKGVFVSEGEPGKEQLIPERSVTGNFESEDGKVSEELVLDRSMPGATSEGEKICLEPQTEDETLENKFALEGETTDTKLTYEGKTATEFASVNTTDMKTDAELTLKDETDKEDQNNLQVNKDPISPSDTAMITLSALESHNTVASGGVAPSLPSHPDVKKEEPEEPRGRPSTEEEGGEPQGKKKNIHKHSKSQTPSSKKKNVRPNYFVGVQISNPEIHQGLLKVQEDLVAWEESLDKTVVDVATSHLTLLVAHLDTEESIAVASAALDESATRLRDAVSASPIDLTFAGVGHFSNQVVFAQVVKDEHQSRFLAMAECVRQVFGERGVCMPDTRPLHLHLTIAKLSKAPRTRGKHPAVKKIDPCSYRQHLDLHFGSQTVSGLQLLAMNKNKDEHRYYHKEKEVAFVNEETDHSHCCFPRRPILPPAPCRTYSTATAAATPGEHRENVSDTWLLPLAGAATIAAGALMLMVALARAQGNQ